MGRNIVIRNLDADLENWLRARSKANGRSMEAEAVEILRYALTEPIVRVKSRDLGQSIHARFAELGGLEMQHSRSSATSPTKLLE